MSTIFYYRDFDFGLAENEATKFKNFPGQVFRKLRDYYLSICDVMMLIFDFLGHF